jgi:DNA-binding response OmpR family regulator
MTVRSRELARPTPSLGLVLGRARRKRIVLVNDRGDLLDLFKLILKPTYEVESFLTGAEALAAIAARPPDLVITDWARPEEVDGRELVARLRRVMPDLPVLLVSGYVHSLGCPAGVTSCLPLPCNGRELSRAVHALIGGAAPREHKDTQK